MQKLRFKDYLHGQGHTACKGQNSNTILSDFKVCTLSTYLLINNDYNVQARGDLIWDEVWRWEWLMPGFHLSHLNILAWSFHFNSFKLSEIKIWTLFLLEVWRERVWGSGETRVGAFSGVLELAHESWLWISSNFASRDLTLIVWNQSWWENLYHRNWQILQIRVLFPL